MRKKSEIMTGNNSEKNIVSENAVVAEKSKRKTAQKSWFNHTLRVFVAVVLIFFAVFFTWYAFFLSSHSYYKVNGASMVPTLNEEIPENKFNDAQGISYDSVYVDKKQEPEIFDVIVIKTNQTIVENGNKMTKTLIKRLMAKGGDFVTLAKTTDQLGNERMSFFRIPSGVDKTNFKDADAILDESGENGYEIYEPNSVWTHQRYFDQALTKQFQVQMGEESFSYEYEYNFFSTFLKDFDAKSEDFYVSEKGLVYVRVPEGKFFYMGDNRAHSSDAREDGFRDLDDIVGPVEIVIENDGIFTRIGTFLGYFFQEVEKFFAR